MILKGLLAGNPGRRPAPANDRHSRSAQPASRSRHRAAAVAPNRGSRTPAGGCAPRRPCRGGSRTPWKRARRWITDRHYLLTEQGWDTASIGLALCFCKRRKQNPSVKWPGDVFSFHVCTYMVYHGAALNGTNHVVQLSLPSAFHARTGHLARDMESRPPRGLGPPPRQGADSDVSRPPVDRPPTLTLPAVTA